MFEEILGNENIKQELIKTVEHNKISHSYLFLGTEGIGKKLFAKDFAKMILGIDLENNPDFQIIEPDGNSIKIDQIRQMQKKIIEAPIKAKRKVYIIDDANLMTVEAQNCLLKTLEEPPKFVNIILVGSNENNFLSTIKSRCTIIKFQPIENNVIKQYLNQKYEIEVSDGLVEVFGGSIGKAEKLKDKQELYNGIIQIIENISKLDLIDLLKSAEIVYKAEDDKNDILESINVILFNKSKEDVRFLNCIKIVEETKKRINANANYNMCIDNMLFRIWEEMH